MQMKRAMELQRAWAAKGNPPCEHPAVEREYHLGSDTGDQVCTPCGAAAPRGTLRSSKRNLGTKNEDCRGEDDGTQEL